MKIYYAYTTFVGLNKHPRPIHLLFVRTPPKATKTDHPPLKTFYLTSKKFKVFSILPNYQIFQFE